MSVFDIAAAQNSTFQNAASAVATSLAPKRHATGPQLLTNLGTSAAKANASTTPTSSTAATAGGTITSADFLTLLVTELQNQDPTQPTDPNAYITQLVGVNSLQQLISINQGITSIGSGTTPTTGVTQTGASAQVQHAHSLGSDF